MGNTEEVEDHGDYTPREVNRDIEIETVMQEYVPSEFNILWAD